MSPSPPNHKNTEEELTDAKKRLEEKDREIARLEARIDQKDQVISTLSASNKFMSAAIENQSRTNQAFLNQSRTNQAFLLQRIHQLENEQASSSNILLSSFPGTRWAPFTRMLGAFHGNPFAPPGPGVVHTDQTHQEIQEASDALYNAILNPPSMGNPPSTSNSDEANSNLSTPKASPPE